MIHPMCQEKETVLHKGVLPRFGAINWKWGIIGKMVPVQAITLGNWASTPSETCYTPRRECTHFGGWEMRIRRAWLSVSAALVAGVAIGWFMSGKSPVYAGGSTDRHEDFVMATGPVNGALINRALGDLNGPQFTGSELDGLWVLDYKSGKLQASAINRNTGRMSAISEVDLVREFEIAPRSNVHFMMTTGNVIKGQSVLYLLETSTGKLGVYSMSNEGGNAVGAQERIIIRRHDMISTRSNSTPANPLLVPAGGASPPPPITQGAGYNPSGNQFNNTLPNGGIPNGMNPNNQLPFGNQPGFQPNK